jgi:hypothetical protein
MVQSIDLFPVNLFRLFMCNRVAERSKAKSEFLAARVKYIRLPCFLASFCYAHLCLHPFIQSRFRLSP